MGMFSELMNPRTGIRKMPRRKKPYGIPSFCLKFSHFSRQFPWQTHSTSSETPIGHMKKVVMGSRAIMGSIRA